VRKSPRKKKGAKKVLFRSITRGAPSRQRKRGHQKCLGIGRTQKGPCSRIALEIAKVLNKGSEKGVWGRRSRIGRTIVAGKNTGNVADSQECHSSGGEKEGKLQWKETAKKNHEKQAGPCNTDTRHHMNSMKANTTVRGKGECRQQRNKFTQKNEIRG